MNRLLFAVAIIFLGTLGPSILFANQEKELPGITKEISRDEPDMKISLTKKIPDHMIMQDVFKNFTALIPYMSNPIDFTDPKNDQKIYSHILNVSMAFQNATHAKMLNSQGFKPSLQTMQEHLKGTADAFSSNHKNFALSRLRAASTMCISCHSQLPKEKGLSFNLMVNQVNRKNFNSDFTFAEYLFIVRNYDKAIKSYENAINEAIKNGQSLSKMEKELFQVQGPLTRVITESLNQILQISLKIQQDPKKALMLINKIKKNGKLPKFIYPQLENIKGQLDVLEKVTLKAPSNDSELEEFIKKQVEGHQTNAIPGEIDLKLLQVSGILSRYLNSHFETTDVPLIYYWLSFAERQISKTFYFGLSDIYLKECIRTNPKHAYAKKCFDEYEEQLTFGYTGSSGTFIPDDEKKELAELKALVKTKYP